ncbi:MAG: cyclic nucleotide-binding domain-containing protein [Deltaproteobacteria bacterium]|nr:cyclic nucleotide-binding domain-containing protein [Deltaproteobacteria bacterium]
MKKFEKKTYTKLLGKVWNYEDGELIFDEGTVSGWVFVVAYGEVEIYRMIEGKKVILDHIREGESIGELSFFDQQPRSAAARAIGKVGLMRFKDEILMEEYEKLPDHFKVLLEAMALRMRSLMKKVTLLAISPEILELLEEESKEKE